MTYASILKRGWRSLSFRANRPVRRIMGRIMPTGLESATGEWFLSCAHEFTAQIGGKPSAYKRGLDELVRRGDNQSGKVHSILLDAFLPQYERNLFQYYRQHQYFILARFLQYPFLEPTLSAWVQPYEKGLAQLDQVDVLDYGCGVPYGLIMSLKTQRHKIRSVSLVDLDLIHLEFAEFIIKRLAPDLPLSICRLRDSEELPRLTGPYNLFFGKDVFEHLHSPDLKLRHILQYRADQAVCYFDFDDKGPAVGQHVNPQLAPLASVLLDLGFESTGNVSGLQSFQIGWR